MFNNSEITSIGFKSSWKSIKSFNDIKTQTNDVIKEEKQQQTTSTKTKEVQTELEKNTAVPEVDQQKLVQFLKKVYPKVESELKKIEKYQALASYNLVSDKNTHKNVIELVTKIEPKEIENSKKVSALSWNSTGNILAIAFATCDHNDWCNHGGSILLYNVGSDKEKLVQKVETTSCVLTMSMHPHEPMLIAAGTFNGEIFVWSLQDDEIKEMVPASGIRGHGDAVTQIEWVNDIHSERFLLLSSAVDGYLMVWKVQPKSYCFNCDARYIMEKSDLACPPGITCFGYSPKNPTICVVAVEGGQLYCCYLDSDNPVTKVAVENQHHGDVTCISFSPFQKDMFATMGTNLQIKIYILGEPAPFHTIWCDSNKVGIQWCNTQENVLAAWGSGNHVDVYDVLSGNLITKLSTSDQQNDKLLSTMQYNKKRPQYLAIGDVDGYTYIWKIPLKFVTNNMLSV